MMRPRLLLGAGAAVLLLAGAIFLSGGPAPDLQESKEPAPRAFEVGIPTAQEVRNMLSVYGTRVETTEEEVRALRKELEKAREDIRRDREEELSGLERLLRDLQGKPADTASPDPPPARFRTFEFEKPTGRSLRIPAGSFGEATLLTGVFAPTSGEAMPVLLRLDTALIGPQRSRVPLREALLVGKASGDANSRRAVVQLDTLSVVGSDGAPFEVRVNGWVTDDDGIQGLRGRYVWKAEEIAVLSSLTGALSGGAEAMSQRETTTQVTPLGGSQGAVTGDPVKFSGYRALSSAFGRLSEVVSRRLDEIVPAVYVRNSRRVTVSFIAGVTLEGFEVPGPSPGPFEGLDR